MRFKGHMTSFFRPEFFCQNKLLDVPRILSQDIILTNGIKIGYDLTQCHMPFKGTPGTGC